MKTKHKRRAYAIFCLLLLGAVIIGQYALAQSSKPGSFNLNSPASFPVDI